MVITRLALYRNVVVITMVAVIAPLSTLHRLDLNEDVPLTPEIYNRPLK